MKRLLLIPIFLLAACAPQREPVDEPEPIIEGDEMVAEMGAVVGEDPGDGAVLFAGDVIEHAEDFVDAPIRVAGTVSEVCLNAGCWLTFQNEAGVAFRVTVPRNDDGYAFTFPQDISGSQVLVAGTLSIEETDVETLRHLAEDRGDSGEAIAAITEPERTLILIATGARIESDLDMGFSR